MSYSPWGHKELDMTESLTHTHTHTHTHKGWGGASNQVSGPKGSSLPSVHNEQQLLL